MDRIEIKEVDKQDVLATHIYDFQNHWKKFEYWPPYGTKLKQLDENTFIDLGVGMGVTIYKGTLKKIN